MLCSKVGLLYTHKLEHRLRAYESVLTASFVPHLFWQASTTKTPAFCCFDIAGNGLLTFDYVSLAV